MNGACGLGKSSWCFDYWCGDAGIDKSLFYMEDGHQLFLELESLHDMTLFELGITAHLCDALFCISSHQFGGGVISSIVLACRGNAPERLVVLTCNILDGGY